jgi:hypothetical protein
LQQFPLGNLAHSTMASSPWKISATTKIWIFCIKLVKNMSGNCGTNWKNVEVCKKNVYTQNI